MASSCGENRWSGFIAEKEVRPSETHVRLISGPFAPPPQARPQHILPLLLAGLARCDVQIEDPPALPAAQSYGVLKHVHLTDGYSPRVFDDTPVEHRRRLIIDRVDRIVRCIHDDGNPSDHLIDGNVMRHSAGAAGEDQLLLVFKPLQGDAERMHGETLLYEGSAVKYLSHDNPLCGVTRIVCVTRPAG